MKTILAVILMVSGMVGGLAGGQTVKPGTTQPPRPAIEVVFVIDTTGSMGGLIQAAKEKVWAIANTLARTEPTPRIKMGLVAYRDRGDDYITQRTDLTADLDAVYCRLMEFKANGGGDGPESVNQALHEAVTALSWSKDSGTYRVIFLVGDWPPHMDYKDDIKYPDTCQKAARAGIVINTIQCGDSGDTQATWTDIAHKAEGRYFRVEQSGSAIVISTPFDKPLADLSRQLEETRLYYGDPKARAEGGEKRKTADKILAAAPAGALAQRAAFCADKAGTDSFLGDSELVRDVSSGRVKVKDLKTETLPEPMRKMSPAERETFVAKNQSQRDKILAQVKDLTAKRQAYLEKEVRARKATTRPTLDFELFECIQDQGGRKGLVYEKGPAF